MRIRVLVVLGTMVLLLAACTSASPSASPEASEPEASEPEASEPAEETPAPEESETAATPAAGEIVSVFDLNVGDCINLADDGTVDEVERVDCDTPHDNEVYFAFDYPGDAAAPYPGDEPIREASETECEAEFASFVGMDYQDSVLYVLFLRPSADTWDDGDREILCTLYLPDEQLTGSMEGANR